MKNQLCFPEAIKNCEEEAIEFLRENEPKEGYFVGFSGGKDSIVTLDLCRKAGVNHSAFYSMTGIDPPDVYEFIRKNYPDVVWLRPKENFWKLILRKGPPSRWARWCCDDLKKKPAKNIPLKHRIMGIRAEESVRRASRPRIQEYTKLKYIMYKPIFYWKEWQIWEYIEKYSLPYCKLYDEGLGRIGCIVCPFVLGKSKGAVKKREYLINRYPTIWKLYERTVREWYRRMREKRGENFKYKDRTDEEYWKWYIGEGE